jgi:hypothetical protein
MPLLAIVDTSIVVQERVPLTMCLVKDQTMVSKRLEEGK